MSSLRGLQLQQSTTERRERAGGSRCCLKAGGMLNCERVLGWGRGLTLPQNVPWRWVPPRLPAWGDASGRAAPSPGPAGAARAGKVKKPAVMTIKLGSCPCGMKEGSRGQAPALLAPVEHHRTPPAPGPHPAPCCPQPHWGDPGTPCIASEKLQVFYYKNAVVYLN